MSAEPASQPPLVEVAAAVIRDTQGRVLLSQRPEGKHLAGLWEFPGGKREPGESFHDALARELHEELGIEVQESKPLLSLTHHYREKTVRLLIRSVDEFSGTATGCEGQRVGWFELSTARALPMPEADRPILGLLPLDPRLVLVSVRSPASIEAIVNEWKRCLQAGFRLLQLSPQGLNHSQLASLAQRCGQLTRRAGARWLLGGRPELVEALSADGVHLSSDELAQFNERPVASDRILAVSCSDEDALQRAGRVGADIACMSLQNPGSADLESSEPDWQRFANCVAASPIPLMAFTDGPEDLGRARELGAFGIAFAHVHTPRKARVG